MARAFPKSDQKDTEVTEEHGERGDVLIASLCPPCLLSVCSVSLPYQGTLEKPGAGGVVGLGAPVVGSRLAASAAGVRLAGTAPG